MKKVIVILGQTATRKSDLAVRIAKKFNGEIISLILGKFIEVSILAREKLQRKK